MGDLSEAQGEAADAVVFYEKASDLYSSEEATSTSNACKLKVATLSATLEDYTKARPPPLSHAHAPPHHVPLP